MWKLCRMVMGWTWLQYGHTWNFHVVLILVVAQFRRILSRSCPKTSFLSRIAVTEISHLKNAVAEIPLHRKNLPDFTLGIFCGLWYETDLPSPNHDPIRVQSIQLKANPFPRHGLPSPAAVSDRGYKWHKGGGKGSSQMLCGASNFATQNKQMVKSLPFTFPWAN